MPDFVHRTLTLRTAVSAADFTFNGEPHTLEETVREIHRHRRTVPQRRVSHDGLVVESRNIRTRRGLFLHLVAYTPDDQISVVPDAGNVASADLELIDPPEDTEFLDGELMLLVHGDDVAICRSQLSERALISYVVQLGQHLGIPSQGIAFDLLKRADMDKLALIQREGVRRLSMRSVAHEASVAHAQRDTIKKRLVGSIVDEVRALLHLEDDVPEDAENLKVEVLLSFDGRRGTEIDQRQIEALAERALREDDPGFMIETISGKKIRATDIVLSKVVQVRPFGKSVNFGDVWGELAEFYAELNQI